MSTDDQSTTVLAHDPDIGPMQAVVLPATSIVLEGVPVVCDVGRELLIVAPGTTPNEIVFAIWEHHRKHGQRPRAVILPMPEAP
ncbi:MAG TPA: hypothetical protein VJP45_10475 [Candidatus Limnocylindria bacterium]|nr:hypothetical protein [Candidatus Limnocylindria bacterium]